METGEIIFATTMVIGVCGCAIFTWLCFRSLGNSYDGGRVYLGPWLAPAYAGLGFCPIINFLAVLVTVIYLVATQAKEQ